ncbi:MAG: 50S ribosomal protein L11 methyltransferase [Bacteroidetes bacterium]|nr:50S ribosomal protein L11 methyltransferase [Bacteroidota bacterium]
MNYLNYQFTVTPPEPGSEILMAIIADFGFDTFNTTPNGFEAFIKEDEAKNINLSDLKFDDFNYAFTIQKIEQTNWNNEWEKNFEPVIIDDLLAIRANFHQPINNVKFNIEITPKMSFGTGHHQTTRLVSKQLFNLNFKDKRVLDMGCGTGILAILSEFLGAKNVLGIDIDEWSVENSIENVTINKCKTIHIKKGDIQDLEIENNFDIILANINKNILKQHIPSYSKKLNADGKLILSGFFTTDTAELIDLCKQHQLVLDTNNFENEWAMLMLSKH